MHQIFFSVKRVHLRIVEMSKKLVAEYELTPARFDMLRIVDAHWPHPVLQSKLKELLGVSAATVSRMLISLEKLGFVERTESPIDARNLLVSLTEFGWERVDTALSALVHTAGGPVELIARRGVEAENKLALLRLRLLQKYLNAIRRCYGDTSPFVHPWRDDDLVPYEHTVLVNGRIRFTADIGASIPRYEEKRRRCRSRSYAAAFADAAA